MKFCQHFVSGLAFGGGCLVFLGFTGLGLYGLWQLIEWLISLSGMHASSYLVGAGAILLALYYLMCTLERAGRRG